MFDILVGVLTVLWSVGCVLLPLWGTVTLFREGDRGMAASLLLIGFPIGCLFATLPWAFISEQKSPDLATLKKNEWRCSTSHTVVSTTYVMSGKVMIPITSSHQECNQYDKL
jgi:hypothetical protein